MLGVYGGKGVALPPCSKVALADTVEDPLEAPPLCSKVALADPDGDPLEASPFCGGGIDAKRCWRKMLVAPLWQGNIAVTPPSPSKLEQACAKLTSQMFASLFSWVARTCSFNAGDPGCLKVFFEKHRSLSALKGRLWAIPFFKFLSRLRS